MKGFLNAIVWLVSCSAAFAQFGARQPVSSGGPTTIGTAVAVDFDGDGDLDVLSQGVGGLFAFEKTASGFTERHLLDESSMRAMQSADFDGDGLPDVVIGRFTGVVSWYRNLGGFTLGAESPLGGLPGGIREMAVGDLDSNGTLDVCVGAGREVHWYPGATGSFGMSNVLSPTSDGGGNVNALSITDLDGDGRLDIAVRREMRLDWFRQLAGGFGPIQFVTNLTGLGGDMAAGDLDGDGDQDLAWTQGSDAVTWSRNNGDGTFQPGLTLGTYEDFNAGRIVACDFDADQDDDLLVGYTDFDLPTPHIATYFESFGDGTFSAGSSRLGIVRDAADLDSDGDVDWIGGTVSGDVSFWPAEVLDPIGSSYCVAAQNWRTGGARIGALGDSQVAAQDVTLFAKGLPAPGTAGLFFFGGSAIQTPFGDGFRCVGGFTTRVQPPALASSTLTIVRTLDFQADYASAIQAGATLNFQLWYRDPMAMGTGFNLSNGTSVAFQ